MSETKFLEGIFSLDSDKNTQAKILKEHKNGIYENSIKFLVKLTDDITIFINILL